MLDFIRAAVIGPLTRLWALAYRPVPDEAALPSGIGLMVGEGDVLLQVRGPRGDFYVPLTPAGMRALCWAGWAAAREAESGPRARIEW